MRSIRNISLIPDLPAMKSESKQSMVNNKTKHTYTEFAPVEFTNLPRIYPINFLGNNSYVLDFMNFYPI